MTTSKEKYKKAIKVNNTSTSTAHVKRITILLYTLWLYMQWRRKQMESVHVCEWGMGGLGLSEILSKNKMIMMIVISNFATPGSDACDM